MRKIDRVKRRFVEAGLEIALYGHPKYRRYAKEADGKCKIHLIALCCSPPPEGFAR